MTSPDISGEHLSIDLTRTKSQFSHPVHGMGEVDDVIDLTDADIKHTDVPEHVIEALRNMIVHEVVELEKIARPDPLAPIAEQKKFTYRTAEMYGAVEALTRFKELLEGQFTQGPNDDLDSNSTHEVEKGN